MLRFYSIIVPVLNKHQEIIRTLQSIAESMTYLDVQHPNSADIEGEVIVVDEGSTDGTFELVRDFVRDHTRFRLVQHYRSLGIGPARNTGVRVSRGDILFYCDGDDLFMPEHIYVCFCLLDHSASGNTKQLCLNVGMRGQIVLPANHPIAGVRTGVHVKDVIHPYWKSAIEGTIMQNLCVRRECHEFGEGFAEAAVYKSIRGCEDVAYNHWLNCFFRIGRVDVETVEYIRYPGNSFDRQLAKFQQPPDGYSLNFTAEERSWHELRMRLEEERFHYLLDKWMVLGPPRVPPSLLNWNRLVRELLQRRMVMEAMAVTRQAEQQGQAISAGLTEEIKKRVAGR
jgi:glycosyltransferase involved in cell wall biosynthesis